MARDEYHRRKLPFRARGHQELEKRIGGVAGEIEKRLPHTQRVRVLELGCGYGTALLELGARFGSRVALHGLNRVPADGNPEILLRSGLERGLLVQGAKSPLPSLVYADVAGGLPFDDCTFDVVFSQVAWLYFGNKIAVLREVARVLDDSGIAKIDADEVRADLPPEYQRLVEIWEGGRILPFREYLLRNGMEMSPAAEGEYLRFGKSSGFGHDLELVLQVDLSTIHEHWDGIKCVYRSAAHGSRSG